MLLALHLLFIIVLEVLVRRYANGSSFSGSNSAAYFAWQYLAIMYAVGMGLAWEVVDISVRRMEPYYQMSRPNGALARDSLLLDYMTAFQYFVPFYSAKRRHWAVLLSSTGHLVTRTALPSLASALWKISWSGQSSWRADVTIQTPFLRAIQAINAFIMLLILLLAAVLQRRPNNLQRDPSSLRALAALIVGSPVVELFRQIPSYESHKTIRAMLGDTKFELKTNDSAMGCQIDYRASEEELKSTPAEFKQNKLEAHPWILWGRTITALQLLLLIPAIVILVGVKHENISPTVVLVLYTLTVTSVSTFWQTAQRDVSLLQPYVELIRRKESSAKSLSFEFLHLAPLTLIVTAWKRNTPLLVTVSFCSLILQLQTIFLPIILNELYVSIYTHRYDQPSVIENSYDPVAWIGRVFSLFVFGGSVALLFCRRKPMLPRNVNTLASHILYICNSGHILGHVEGTFGKDANERTQDDLSSCCFGWHKRENEPWFVGIGREQPGWKEYVYGEPAPGTEPDKR